MRHPDGRRMTVPVHAGRDIRPGVLRNILRDTAAPSMTSGGCGCPATCMTGPEAYSNCQP